MIKTALILALVVFFSFSTSSLAQNNPDGRNELRLLRTSTEGGNLKIISPSAKVALNVILGRLGASVSRVEKIAERISLRLEKIRISGAKVTKVSSKYSSLKKQLTILDAEFAKVKDLSTNLESSSDSQSDYKFFREQFVVTRSLLDDILSMEKSIVSDMKQYVVPTTTPTTLPTLRSGQ